MTTRERLLGLLGVWLAVYSLVLLMGYGLNWPGLGWPMWAEILVATALALPLVGFAAAPKVRGVIAAAENSTPANLARREALRTGEAERVREAGA